MFPACLKTSGFRRMGGTKSRVIEGTERPLRSYESHKEETRMNGVIYLIGLVVVVLAILSFLGLS